jgi:signal transduction histidine kinase
MIRHFDNSLLTTAKMLSAVIEDEEFEAGGQKDKDDDNDKTGSLNQSARRLDFEFDVGMMPEFDNINGGAYYQFWSRDGAVVVRSPSLGTKDIPCFGFDLAVPEYHVCTLPDGKKGRAIGYQFLPRTEKDSVDKNKPSEERLLSLTAAKDATELYAHLNFLKWLLLGSSIIIVFISTAIAYLVAQTSLRPIHVFVRKIGLIREDNLAQQFSSEKFPAELRPICACLNDLFQRLEASFNRERQFNANVAHELRTPLAGMQAMIEVCLLRPRETAEYRDSLRNCLEIVNAMNRIVNILLDLSKFDSGHVTIQKESIPLKKVVDDLWRNFADKAYDKKIGFQNAIQEEMTCESAKDYLSMIISNILDNAVEYTNSAGRIWIKAKRVDDAIIVLSISNTGCCLTQEEILHVFDFFWRKDKSRTDTGRHCGAGLTVARKVAGILGLDINAGLENDGVFTISLRLPANITCTIDCCRHRM